MAGKAVPPSKLSHQIECRAGVTPLDGGSSFWAHLRWRQEAPPGQPTVVFQEDLGCKGKPWFAGVSHDVALCSRAYHAGDRTLRRVTSAGAGCLAGGDALVGRTPAPPATCVPWDCKPANNQHPCARPPAEEGLNFPLASYLNQPEFWRALDMRPGELALKLKTNRELEKVRGGGLAGAQQGRSRRVVPLLW